MIRLISFLFGFFLLVWGIFYILAYSNLFTFGVSFFSYVIFLFTTFEFYYVFIGFLLIVLSLYFRRKK